MFLLRVERMTEWFIYLFLQETLQYSFHCSNFIHSEGKKYFVQNNNNYTNLPYILIKKIGKR